jgi:DNA-binding beta-propeller fold protein YncE
MSSTEWGQPGPGFPNDAPRQRIPGWVKLGVLLLLLIGLGWVTLLAVQYFRTGDNLGDLPGMPEPVADLFDRPSFTYVASIDGLTTPMGVAVGPDGRIYVSESGGGREIHIYDALFQELGTFAPPDTQPAERVPVYLAVNPAGDVYVSDRGSATIYTFDADGNSKGTVAAPAGFEDWHPLGLTFDAEGNLYVADVTPDKHRILVLDPVGNLKLSFGKQGELDGEFWYPKGVAVDSEGRIFVADSNNGRMQAFDSEGNFLFKISRGMSPGDLSMPRGIAVDSEDRLLIADTSRGAVQAYKVTGADGSGDDGEGDAPVSFLGTFYGSVGDGVYFGFPNGLALDGKGKIYVTDRSNNRVQVWEY